MLEDLDLSRISDPYARECIVRLLNVVEEVTAALRESQAEVRRLRDEIARLNGEKGKPDIKASKPKPPPGDYSSERERHAPKAWSKGSKTAKIHIDREQVLRVDRESLPADAEFKDYEDTTVQDVILRTDNVLFRKEKFYSASEGKSYLARVPRGYEGESGPGLKSLVITLYFASNMTEPKIAVLHSVGVQISDGQVSNLLIKEQGAFHVEKGALFEAGLASSPWQHLDRTGTRVGGQNRHCQVLCNPPYTAYRTTETKDRMSVLDTLRNGRPRGYLLNEEAEGYLARTQMSQVAVRLLKAGMAWDKLVNEATMKALLEGPLSKLGPQQQRWVLDATAVAAYHFMSLAESAKKLRVSFYDYVHDRILGTNLIPRLDTLLTERAATMRLSPSWINS